MTAYLLECIDCGKHHLPTDAKYLCSTCGLKRKPMEPLPGLLRCIYDYETTANFFTDESLSSNKAKGFDRWAHALPIKSSASLPQLITFSTPLRHAQKLGTEFDLANLWLKDDTVMPTASYKDRASSVVVAMAKELGHSIIATASTGNAATALAGHASAAELQSVIFVPASAPKAKLTQIAAYGGQIVLVDAGYDRAFELSIEVCDAFGWYNRNTAFNPFTIEGKKTAAFEIWEQLGYQAPDWIVVPTGDGVIAAGIEKGFSDLAAMGLIGRVPRLALVQAAGCRPIVRAFESEAEEIVPERNPQTIADSIRVGVPRAGRWALRSLRSTGGAAVAVEDEDILKAIFLLGHTSGIFAEPAAAASIAGLKRLAADGIIKRDDSVVALITGSGLKDVPAAMKAVDFPEPIEPTLEAVKRSLKL